VALQAPMNILKVASPGSVSWARAARTALAAMGALRVVRMRSELCRRRYAARCIRYYRDYRRLLTEDLDVLLSA